MIRIMMLSASCLSFLCTLSASSAADVAATPIETVDVERPWGKVRFHRGFPCSMTLDLGSGADLLPGSFDEDACGAIVYREEDRDYSTFHDARMECSIEGETVVFRGSLRDRGGAVSKHEAAYVLTWTVSDLGYVRLDARLTARNGRFPGTTSYRFPFDAGHLKRYYHTGFQPAAVRRSSSLRNGPLEEIASTGMVFSFQSDVIDRIIGFVRSETETLNFVASRGFFGELSVANHPPAMVTYVDATPASRDERSASFYILPAPV